MIDWHRLFGIALTAYFQELPFVVELEKDLSLKKQLLDVVILRKEGDVDLTRLPDGLENLQAHNLLTYKSHHEALNEWALDELLGHYVNYRKQVSPTVSDLLPKTDFQLYAICTARPHLLVNVGYEKQQDGVYDFVWGSQSLRLLVLSEMRVEQANAVWLLFSRKKQKILSGANWFRNHAPNISRVLNQLLVSYQMEGLHMAYTMEDFNFDYVKESLKRMTPKQLEEALSELSAEERLKGVPAEEVLEAIPAEERLKGVPAEEVLEAIPAEEILEAIPAEERQRLKQLLEELDKKES